VCLGFAAVAAIAFWRRLVGFVNISADRGLLAASITAA
jgi:hypothetical protein